MPGTALFGSAASRGQTKNLVEFKAGKMTLKETMVYPDKRKGLVYIYQSDDSLMHFCWKDRSNGSIEDDLIIFPDDVEFKKVQQCTTGRVYLLKFKSSSRKFFFWLQEPKTDKDDDNCRKVNEILNNPPALGSQRSGGATPDGDLQNMLSNMSQQQLMQLFGGVGQIGGLSSLLGTMNQSSRTSGSGSSSVPSSAPTPAAVTSAPPISSPAPAAAVAPATPATPADAAIPRPTRPAAPAKPAHSGLSSTDRGNIQLRQLQNYFLQNLDSPATPTGAAATGVDLSSSVNPESLQAILNNPEFVRELSRHLPSQGDNTQEDLRSTLASPQFQQALSMFSTALQSGQLGPVVSQFEVGNEAVSAANQGNMEEFVRALQAATISSTASPQQSKTADEKEAKHEDKKLKKDDDDEDMNLD
ncbi:Proteasome complex subunit Rpn13 ubiquitin receptor [Nesidiocoris tenuis]|uniref:Proteasome complex subunit Rpn13 ubiquitin receptor n=1 Tax=Nesidiocoris tenuis TaxID=355587 RepID=A0ABN7AJI3_9HEMI|nr:Proteasome complex subunit Rpn13 ubiquitin receptor [Nesidiocoris tenuis]